MTGIRLIALGAASMALAAAITPFEPVAQEAQPRFDTTEVAPGVYSFRWLSHRSLFVVTSDGVVVADPLNPEAARTLAGEIARVTPLPVTHVIYSHEHWDHILGARALTERGATVLSHARCLPAFDANPNPDLVRPSQTFDGALHEFEVGGRPFRLRYLGPNHGDCLIVVELPDDGLIFTPDLVTPRTLGYRTLPDYDPHGLLRSLKALEKLPFDRIVPGHGPPVADRSAVAEEREYFEDLFAAVEAAWRSGIRDPAAMAESIQLPKYQDWFGYEWLPLNVERVWATYHMGWSSGPGDGGR